MTQRSQGLTLLEENKQQTALSAGEYPSAKRGGDSDAQFRFS